jgi:hypothetical protein
MPSHPDCAAGPYVSFDRALSGAARRRADAFLNKVFIDAPTATDNGNSGTRPAGAGHAGKPGARTLGLGSHCVTAVCAWVVRTLELSFGGGVTTASLASGWGCVMSVFLLCGLPASLAAIPGRFLSSLLPPSFAPGRRTAAFPATGTATRGARFSLPGAVA